MKKFTLSKEDFPALPGTRKRTDGASTSGTQPRPTTRSAQDVTASSSQASSYTQLATPPRTRARSKAKPTYAQLLAPPKPKPPKGKVKQAGGSQVQPGGSQVQPGGSQVQPGGSQMQPGGSQMQPGGSQMQPGGSQMQPGGSQMQPSGSQMQTARIQFPTSGLQIPTGRLQIPPALLQIPPRGLSLQSIGIDMTPDGRFSNIPANMVSDQFGLLGLLAGIRAAEADPEFGILAYGQDLAALEQELAPIEQSVDPNVNSPSGPWGDHPCNPPDVRHHVPPEYLISYATRDKLAEINMRMYRDDLIFYLFYTRVRDVLQIAAAAELYSRGWRYHMVKKVWMKPVPKRNLIEKSSTYERGRYFFFDVKTWKSVEKEFRVEYAKLEGRPVLNTLRGERPIAPDALAAGESAASTSRAGASAADTSAAGPSGDAESRAGPSRAGPYRAAPYRAGPSRAGPSRAGPSRAGPSRAGPSRASTSKAGTSRRDSSRTKK